jgi:glucose-6-phosphate 1-dehydrogenase
MGTWLTESARDSREKYGGVDPDGRSRPSSICAMLVVTTTMRPHSPRYGNNYAPRSIRAYLVTPPALFGKVIDQLKASGCARTRRAVVEKPFRHDEALARPCKAQSEGVGAVTTSAG